MTDEIKENAFYAGGAIIGMLLFVIFAGVLLAGTRIVVAPASAEFPDGATMIVSGVADLNLIDSPNAMCLRTMGETPPCMELMSVAISQNKNILFRFPYIGPLNWASRIPYLIKSYFD